MNLLIVEDENIIRKGFLVTVQKLNFAFDNIYEAGDGEKGLQLCKAHHPEIIITDIRMPLMDGLTFIRKAKAFSPDSQFIILSGYNDFEYARTALQYGVRDYLLKPSSKAEIRDVLTRVTEEIRSAQTTRKKVQYQLEQFQQLLLLDILQNKYPADQIEASLSGCSVMLPKNGVLVLCFHILPENCSDIPHTDYKRHIDWFLSLLSPFFYLIPIDVPANYHCLIASPLTGTDSSLLPLFQKLANQIQAYQEKAHIWIHFSFTPMENDVRKLPALYQKASEFLFCRFFSPDRILLSSHNCPNCDSGAAIPGAMLESLYHCFIGKSRFDLRQNFLSLLRYLAKLKDITPSAFASALEQAFQYLVVTLIRENRIPEYPVTSALAVWNAFSVCDDPENLFHTLVLRLMDYREAVSQENHASVENLQSPISQAISYIDQNYYKELDLTLISRLVSMNSSYFSTQFKKRTGLSFSTYLQNVRLEKSKSLLLNSNQKLYEISESVGISNVKYFCRLFKDYTGVTPTEFRKGSFS